MDSRGEIKIIDGEGWTKKRALEKTITQIGSDPASDIVLDVNRGRGVAPRHVQLICLPNAEHSYRLVNLSDTDIQIGATGERALSARSVVDIVDGEIFRLGDFTLVLNSAEGSIQSVPVGSNHIGLELLLPNTPLVPERTLEGTIVLSNLGEREGVQFDLDLEGLPADCYQIEPAPLLFPSAEERVRLHLYHRGDQPLAGRHHITIRVSAPEAYPAEEATISRTIEVLPCYRYELRLLTSERVKAEPPQTEEEPLQTEEEQPAEAESSLQIEREQAVEAESVPPSRTKRWWAWLFPSRRKEAEKERVPEVAPEPPSEQVVQDQPPEMGAQVPLEEARSLEAEAWSRESVEFAQQPQSQDEQEAQASAVLPSEAYERDVSEARPRSPGGMSLWVAPEAEFGPPPAEPQSAAQDQPMEEEQITEPEDVLQPLTRVEQPSFEEVSPLETVAAASPEGEREVALEATPALSAQVEEKVASTSEAVSEQPPKVQASEAEPASPKLKEAPDVQKVVPPLEKAEPRGSLAEEVVSPRGTEGDWWTLQSTPSSEEWWTAEDETDLAQAGSQPDSREEGSPPVRARRVRVLRAKVAEDWKQAEPDAVLPSQEDADWWATGTEDDSQAGKVEE